MSAGLVALMRLFVVKNLNSLDTKICYITSAFLLFTLELTV